MFLIFQIIGILSISFLFILLSNRFRFSEVIGLIAAGLFLSLPIFKHIFTVDGDAMNTLSMAGLFTLMFLSGLEVSWSMLAKEKKDSFILTVSTMLFSLVFGFFVLKMMGFSFEASLIMGVCFGVTAEATKARALLELKKIKTRIGSLLIDSGIINDIFGIVALMVVSYFFSNNFSFGEFWTLVGMVLSFSLGMLAHLYFDRRSFHLKIFEKVCFYGIVPFFFVNIGLSFDISFSTFDPWMFFLVLIVGTMGQMLGTLAVRRLIKIDIKQAWLVGWGMNSKGAIELAIAFVAFKVGILPAELYSSLVVVALISNLIFQVVIFNMVKKYPRIMN